jgi:hypothetical protein
MFLRNDDDKRQGEQESCSRQSMMYGIVPVLLLHDTHIVHTHTRAGQSNLVKANERWQDALMLVV